MSEPTTTVPPEVEAFVAQVRARLTDLSEDEREELLGGLEADLVEKLADGADLGDPWLYAAELRAAAGLPEGRRPLVRTPRLRLPKDEDLGIWLDGARRRFFAEIERHAAGPKAWEVVATLRPVWWVIRAWVAVTVVDRWAGPWERISLIPSLAVPGLGLGLLVVAIVVSTLVGLGRLWPGSGQDRPLRSRVALAILNVAALATILSFSLTSGTYLSSEQTWMDDARMGGPYQPRDGLRLDGVLVRNIFAYDAQGNPLTGVQLFRGNGQALAVSPLHAESAYPGARDRTVGCGWAAEDGHQVRNVFPLVERASRRGYCKDLEGGKQPLTEPTAPFVQVSPVTSPVVPTDVVPSEEPQPGEE